MKIGTRSVLFGVHQFLLHPWFVALAWWRLYGFPWDFRLWVAFFVHDLGYWGKPDMDGDAGETHVELGAEIMHLLFDGDWQPGTWQVRGEVRDGKKIAWQVCWSIPNARGRYLCVARYTGGEGLRAAAEQASRLDAEQRGPWEWAPSGEYPGMVMSFEWRDLCLYHSRFYAKRDGKPFSRLCVADKLAFVLTPRWLYRLLSHASGEIHEYMARTRSGKYHHEGRSARSFNEWHQELKEYVTAWVERHRDGETDTWTRVGEEPAGSDAYWAAQARPVRSSLELELASALLKARERLWELRAVPRVSVAASPAEREESVRHYLETMATVEAIDEALGRMDLARGIETEKPLPDAGC